MIRHLFYGKNAKFGDDHDQVKITDAEVQTIKILHFLFNMACADIAREFETGSRYVSDICAGRRRV